MSGVYGESGSVSGVGLFTADQVVAIRWYCGYGLYAAYGYIAAGGGMAVIDEQISKVTAAEQKPISDLLTLLPTLDTAIQGAGANLDTNIAAVWTRNPNEVQDRTALFRQYRLRLCELLNVQPGPGLERRNRVTRG